MTPYHLLIKGPLKYDEMTRKISYSIRPNAHIIGIPPADQRTSGLSEMISVGTFRLINAVERRWNRLNLR